MPVSASRGRTRTPGAPGSPETTGPQEAWVVHHRAVAEFIGMPEGRMLFCGLAIGHPDPDAAVNGLETERAPGEEWLTVLSE